MQYLIKDTKLNFENDRYETKEYRLLKKWLIFKKNPKDLKDIQIMEEKIDIYLKRNINGYIYKDIKFSKHQNPEQITDQTLKIPDIYLRYSDILNNIVEL